MADEIQHKNKWSRLPKWLRAIIVAACSFIVLNLIFFIGASWYIRAHKQEIIQKISEKVSDNLNGNFHIDDIQFAALKGFPNLSLELKDVTLSDSLYSTYHINLIEVKNIYLKVSLFSLLSHPKIMKIILTNGSIHIFNTANGYSNDYLLYSNHSKDSARNYKKEKGAQVNSFKLENITFNIENKAAQKQLFFVVKKMNASLENTSKGMNIDANSEVYVNGLGFDLAKGSYLKDKNINADFHFEYDNAAKDLSMKMQSVMINETNLNLALDFNFANSSPTYSIKVDAPSIKFKEAESILTQNLQAKFNELNLNFKNNIALQVSVDGHLQGPDDPLIEAKWQAKDNDFSLPFGTLNNATFNGRYYNNVVNGKGYVDENSEITVDALSASFYNIPVQMKNIRLFNLSEPVLDFNVTSDFPVINLDSIVNNTFDFKSGNAGVNLTYHGGLDNDDTTEHTLTGNIHIANAVFTYIPGNINFKNGNVNLVFNPHNLSLENTTLSTVNSDITINGFANNFMDLYVRSPEKIIFNWDINSNKLDFDEFKGLLNNTAVSGQNNRKANSNTPLQSVNNDLANAMQRSSADLHLHIGSVFYKTFSAQNLNAFASFTPDNITLKKASVHFAGGNINADALVNKNSNRLPFQLKTDIQNVDVSRLFEAFQNFGTRTLTSKNIDGIFSSDVSIGGALDTSANLITNSLNGKISFKLTDGELKNFKPFLSIQKYLFKNRDFANVTFKDIKNNFSIDNGMITIPTMTIASNVLEITLHGVYGIDNGTDIGIDVPLHDPQKVAERIAKGEKVRRGIVVHLRAKDNGRGGTKIVWDIFHKTPSKETENINEDN